MMNNVVSLTGLDTLARQIKAEHLAIIAAFRLGIEHAMRAGDLLLKARPQVPHGQWLPWLEECGFGERTAQLYMRLARGRAELESKLDTNTQRIADLSLNEADKLIRESQAKRYFDTEERLVTRATAITSPAKTTDASVPIKIEGRAPPVGALAHGSIRREAPAPAPTPEPLTLSAPEPQADAPDDDHKSTGDIWELWTRITNALIGPDSSFTLEQRLKALDKLEFDVHQLRNRLSADDAQYTTIKIAKSYSSGFKSAPSRRSAAPKQT